MGPDLFGGLAADMAKNAKSMMMPVAGGAPGTMGVMPGAGGAAQNNPGLLGLGGTGTGLMNKFTGMLGGMFGGSGGSAPGMPKLAEGGAVPGPKDNPYTGQVTDLDAKIEAIKNAIVASVPKEQWAEAMQNQVFPLMQQRQELAMLSSEWMAKNPEGTYQPGANNGAPNMQVNPPVGQGKEATPGQTEFGPPAEAKTRKIIIEEKPGPVQTRPSNN